MNASRPTASSRRLAARTDQRDEAIEPIDAALTRVLAREHASPLLVAFSGGIDSTVLLHAASRACAPARLLAVHVHHGLQAAADAWPDHCRHHAGALGIACECVHLAGAPGRGESLEAWARAARYRAFAQVALRVAAGTVLVGHHSDDQVETVLMRAERGAGIDGLAGMREVTELEGLRVVRPLLNISRAQIDAYARHFALEWIEDPSNRDRRRRRNAVRHVVLPALERHDPSFRASVLSVLPALREASERDAEQARVDLERVSQPDGGLDRLVLRALDDGRIAHVLRYWLKSAGLLPPSRARLAQMVRQLVRGDASQGQVRHEGRVLVRHRDRIDAVAASDFDALRALAGTPSFEMRWHGEPVIALPHWGGRLHFTALETPANPLPPAMPCVAVDGAWLRTRALTVGGAGSVSAGLRTAPARRARSLKNLFQEHDVPVWMRGAFPRVVVDGRLLFVASLGQDASAHWPTGARNVSISWEPDRASDPRARFASQHPVKSPLS